MARRFAALLITLLLVSLSAYSTLFDPSATASPQELTVKSRTKGNEVVTAQVVDDQVIIKLKNNHRHTITAFAINFDNTTIKEDFIFSEVHFGIEPGDTFEKSYPRSLIRTGELPTLSLLAVLLKNGATDGNPEVAQQIADVRLGQKIQILRTLRILEEEGQSLKDLKMIESNAVAAMIAGEAETRTILNELQPTAGTESKLSDELKAGLQWGRESIQKRFEAVEQQPTESRERAFMNLKNWARKLFAKL